MDVVIIPVPVRTKRKFDAWRARHEKRIGQRLSEAEAMQALFTAPLRLRDAPLRQSLEYWVCQSIQVTEDWAGAGRQGR